MMYIILIAILLITIIIAICFKNITPFVSLLTAISTLLLGVYQLSKETKRIDFNIQLFRDFVGPTGEPIKALGRLLILNVGHRVVYFESFSLLPNFDTAIIVQSEVKRVSLLKKSLNRINKKWFQKEIQKSKKEIFLGIKVSEEQNKPSNKKPYSFVVHSGDIIDVYFNYKSYIDFFKTGRKFFIKDTTGKRFYLPKDKVSNIKKIISNLEEVQ